MNGQPLALLLAQELGAPFQCDFHVVCEEAAAELRRQHGAIKRLREEIERLQNTKHHEAPFGFVLNPDYLVPELIDENKRLREEAGALRSILGYALRGAVWEDKLICYCDDEDRVQHYRVEIRLPVPESAADKSPEAALARLIKQETALQKEEKK